VSAQRVGGRDRWIRGKGNRFPPIKAGGTWIAKQLIQKKAK